ncbi:YadA-like family protein [Haemophilus parainfluenzae]|uniref:YadA-like family protein n=1 Tax=Haemophilus parainfluenzae TaxID=729 RepID=UPI0018766697|nr:YadA-like family protein [Haemophilus parainfluenzae]MBE4951817.1 YadA-like family protein [Haemophilus parainfluenzae]
MNKVFKVIWNHATQTWTAVSELGHAKGKTKSKKIVKLTALAGAVIGSLAAIQSVEAAESVFNNDNNRLAISPKAGNSYTQAQAVSSFAIAIGVDSKSDSGIVDGTIDPATGKPKTSGSVAIGLAAKAAPAAAGQTALSSVAIGDHATATADSAVAIGAYNSATGSSTVSIGKSSSATSNNAMALGTQSKATADNAISMGAYSEAAGERGTALGVLAQAKGKGSFAGGASAQATGENSVAIGGAQDGTLGNKAGTAANATGNNSIALGTQSIANGENSIAQGKGANAALENSIAIGTNAVASGISIGNEASTIIPDSIAIGHKSNVDGGAEGVAIGNEATNGGASFAAAVGATSGANANYSVALGYNAVANAEYSVALGAASEAGDDFVESRSAEINGIKYENFAASTSEFGTGAVVSVGTAGSERQIKNVAAGQVTKLSTDAINGSQLYAVADSLATKINKQHWNVGNNDGAVVSGVYHEDQVNFVNGNVTTVKVVKAPSKTSMPDGGPNITNVSYDVNVGKGLKIENNKIVANFVAGNGVTFNEDGDKITINAQSTGGAASSVVSGDNNTLSVKQNATNPSEYIVTPITGSLSISKDEKGKVGDDAKGNEDNGKKLTTIQTTRDMINKAHWNLQIGTSSDPKNVGESEITSADQNAEPIHAGDTVNFFAGKNIKLKRQGSDITISAKDASVDTGEIIPATNTTNTNNNGTVMAKDGDGDKFANITNVVNAINSAFWKIGEENSGTVTPKGNVTAGSQVNFSNGVGTIAKVTADEANKAYKVQYDVNAGPGIEIPTDGANKGKVTVKVDNSTVTINDDGQLVANSAWNANATGNVDGTSAAKAVKANATVNFDAGENLKVKQTGDEVNQVYSFSLNQTLTNITSIENKAGGPKLTFGDSSINITGGNLDMGNNQITNLKPGTNGTDAVNLDQLKASRTVVKSSDGSVTVTPSENGLTKTYDLSVDLSKVDLSKAKSSWNVKSSAAEGGNVTDAHNATEKNIADKNTVEFKAGKNLTVEQVNGDTGANVTFALSNNITLDNSGSINIGGTTVKDGDIKIGDTHITNGAVSNLTHHIENATTVVDDSVLNITDDKKKDAATVRDVLNSGWNLQANGQPVDAVTHGNNVNFASDGSVKITPTTDGNTTTLNLSVNATSVVNQVTGDVSANTTTGKAVVGKDGNENTSADAGNKVATVGDVANTINNTGWITKAKDKETGAEKNVTVNPGDRVEYVDGNGTTANVTVETKDGQDTVKVTYDVKTDGTTITVKNGNVTANTGNIIEAKPDGDNAGKVTVTTGDENKVATVKNVADAINSAGWIVNTGKADNQDSFKTETGTAKKVGAGDKVNFQAGKNLEVKREGNNIIYATSDDLNVNNITVADNGSIKIGDTAVKNGDIKIGDTHITNGAVTNLTHHIENATTVVDSNVLNISDEKKKEAATVRDVLNSGWNLQVNGNAVDAVTHGNNVNFTSDGTVEIKPTVDGNTSTLNLSVNATNVVKQVTGNVSANTTTGKAVVGKDGNEDTSADAGNKVATVGDVANTINNTGWITKAKDKDTGAEKNVTVNPGDRVEYVDGKGTKANVTVTTTNGQDVVNVTYDVKTDGTTVTVNDEGNLAVNTGNIIPADDKTEGENAGKVTVKTGDDNKVATVKNVADAINSAGWIVNTGKADNQDSFKTETGTATKVGAGDKVNFQAGKNLEVKREGQNIIYATSEDLDAKTITVTTVKVGKDGKDGVDGSIGVTGKDGAAVAINGKDGSIGLTGPKGADGKDGASVTIKPEKGTTTVAERDGGKEINRVTYTDKDKDGNDIKREIATLDDGLKFTGDDGQTVNRTLGSNLNVKGGATTSTTAKNIRVTKAADGQGLDVNLANNIELDNNGSIKIGDTTVNQDGITINNGPSVTKGGIDAGGKTITNVARGEKDTDAVNVSQLKQSVGDVHKRINKVGKEARGGIAGANAAAGLPQVYLPGKSMVAASAGTFKGESAVAVGYSRSSDNGKVIFKLQGNANTQGDVGGSVGVGYQW